MAIGVGDIFLAAARGMAGAGGHRLIDQWTISDAGKVSVVVTSEEGRRGIGSKAKELLLGRTIPYLEEYLRTGQVPAGIDKQNFELFLKQKPEFVEAYERLHPVEELPFGDEDSTGRVYGGEQKSPIGPEDFLVPRFIRSIPGGAAGFAQQTPAGQRQMFGGNGARRGTPRRKPRPRPVKRASSSRGPVRRSSAKPRPGTKAWMSYIRGLRRKK